MSAPCQKMGGEEDSLVVFRHVGVHYNIQSDFAAPLEARAVVLAPVALLSPSAAPTAATVTVGDGTSFSSGTLDPKHQRTFGDCQWARCTWATEQTSVATSAAAEPSPDARAAVWCVCDAAKPTTFLHRPLLTRVADVTVALLPTSCTRDEWRHLLQSVGWPFVQALCDDDAARRCVENTARSGEASDAPDEAARVLSRLPSLHLVVVPTKEQFATAQSGGAEAPSLVYATESAPDLLSECATWAVTARADAVNRLTALILGDGARLASGHPDGAAAVAAAVGLAVDRAISLTVAAIPSVPSGGLSMKYRSFCIDVARACATTALTRQWQQERRLRTPSASDSSAPLAIAGAVVQLSDCAAVQRPNPQFFRDSRTDTIVVRALGPHFLRALLHPSCGRLLFATADGGRPTARRVSHARAFFRDLTRPRVACSPWGLSLTAPCDFAALERLCCRGALIELALEPPLSDGAPSTPSGTLWVPLCGETVDHLNTPMSCGAPCAATSSVSNRAIAAAQQLRTVAAVLRRVLPANQLIVASPRLRGPVYLLDRSGRMRHEMETVEGQVPVDENIGSAASAPTTVPEELRLYRPVRDTRCDSLALFPAFGHTGPFIRPATVDRPLSNVSATGRHGFQRCSCTLLLRRSISSSDFGDNHETQLPWGHKPSVRIGESDLKRRARESVYEEARLASALFRPLGADPECHPPPFLNPPRRPEDMCMQLGDTPARIVAESVVFTRVLLPYLDLLAAALDALAAVDAADETSRALEALVAMQQQFAWRVMLGLSCDGTDHSQILFGFFDICCDATWLIACPAFLDAIDLLSLSMSAAAGVCDGSGVAAPPFALVAFLPDARARLTSLLDEREVTPAALEATARLEGARQVYRCPLTHRPVTLLTVLALHASATHPTPAASALTTRALLPFIRVASDSASAASSGTDSRPAATVMQSAAHFASGPHPADHAASVRTCGDLVTLGELASASWSFTADAHPHTFPAQALGWLLKAAMRSDEATKLSTATEGTNSLNSGDVAATTCWSMRSTQVLTASYFGLAASRLARNAGGQNLACTHVADASVPPAIRSLAPLISRGELRRNEWECALLLMSAPETLVQLEVVLRLFCQGHVAPCGGTTADSHGLPRDWLAGLRTMRHVLRETRLNPRAALWFFGGRDAGACLTGKDSGSQAQLRRRRCEWFTERGVAWGSGIDDVAARPAQWLAWCCASDENSRVEGAHSRVLPKRPFSPTSLALSRSLGGWIRLTDAKLHMFAEWAPALEKYRAFTMPKQKSATKVPKLAPWMTDMDATSARLLHALSESGPVSLIDDDVEGLLASAGELQSAGKWLALDDLSRARTSAARCCDAYAPHSGGKAPALRLFRTPQLLLHVLSFLHIPC